jgi:hypothetical protein
VIPAVVLRRRCPDTARLSRPAESVPPPWRADRLRAGDGTMCSVSTTSRFGELARDPGVTLDVLALALAAEFRDVDTAGAMARLDMLGEELARVPELTGATPEAQTLACGQMIGAVHGFVGDREHYADPHNSMLDLVLRRRRGLPIALSVVYVEVARRAGIPLAGVGLGGHFVVGHFGADPPVRWFTCRRG